MAIHEVFPEQYEQQLTHKVDALKRDFSRFKLPEIEVFDSPASHYRLRAEFKIWQDGERASYAMYKPGASKESYTITEFPVACELINDLMGPLLEAINANPILRTRLFQVEFLTTLSGEALITLLYHKRLNEEWETAARLLKTDLSRTVGSLKETTSSIDLIGRSRKQKVVMDRDYVIEELGVDGKTFKYQQVETGFTQPNGQVCQKMLTWAVNQSRDFGKDLLELYCGNGNFTLPLAQNFRQVLATELAKSSLASAEFNQNLNAVTNLALVRMSSEDFAQALDKVRPFKRLRHIDLDTYDFSTIFVDPPRAGLDPHTARTTQRFEHILYISCNPDTLKHNLDVITQTHDIAHFAVFDQFPYTHHLECGVVLKRR